MTRVAVLGASGRIATHAVEQLASREDIDLTLVLRDAARLGAVPERARVLEGDVLDRSLLAEAVRDQDVVYANLAGDVADQARAIVEVMGQVGSKRLIFVTSLGILDEVPGAFGQWNRQMIGSMLTGYREASDIIEASDLDYTILRPAWLSDEADAEFEVTERDQPFRGTEVSRRGVAAFVVALIDSPTEHLRANLGVNKPGTDGDKPSFM